MQLSEGPQDTYFISLGAVDQWGLPTEESTFFDWFSKVEMEHTKVRVRSVQDLKAYNDLQIEQLGYDACPLAKATRFGGRHNSIHHIYHLLEVFIKGNPNANFIVDEFPLTANRGTGW